MLLYAAKAVARLAAAAKMPATVAVTLSDGTVCVTYEIAVLIIPQTEG